MSDYKHIDAKVLSAAFLVAHGLHHPDWEKSYDLLKTGIAVEHRDAAWAEILDLWLNLLKRDLGEGYFLIREQETILLCNQSSETARRLLAYCVMTVNKVRQCLGRTAWEGDAGQVIVLVFADDQTYYQYVSHYSKDGEQATSGGMSIRRGHPHIAIPYLDPFQVAHAIVHELAHDSVAHLPLPNWLNEALAQNIEKLVLSVGNGPHHLDAPLMWDELAERHFAFWNEENIQRFWAGKSFFEPGDSNELSYSLAEVFLKLMSDRCNPTAFRAFLEAASYDDSGVAAAKKVLNVELGEIAATFLGKGDWKPRPESFAQIWAQSGEE